MTVHLNLNQINQSIQLNIFIAAISHINGLNGGHIKLVLELNCFRFWDQRNYDGGNNFIHSHEKNEKTRTGFKN